MTSATITDVIDRQLAANHQIVTHRTLARELKIDTEQAKNALSMHHAASNGRTWATYIIAGDDAAGNRHFLFAPQDAVEEVKQQLVSASVAQIYSLSVAPLKDHSIVGLAARLQRSVDNAKTPLKPRAPGLASTSSKPSLLQKESVKQDEKPKPKPGTLNFSKAKVKDETKAAPAALKDSKGKLTGSVPSSSAVGTTIESKPEVKPKTKKISAAPIPLTDSRPSSRASTVPTTEPDEDADEDVIMPDALPRRGSSRKGRVVLSDDEDEDEPSTKARHNVTADSVAGRKRKILLSDDEDSMDVDSRANVDLYEDTEPEHKVTRKKAMKSQVPVGSNGRPKKRVVKERFTTDQDGSMVTEDYSEYETDNDASNDDGEMKPQAPVKPKPAVKSTSKPAGAAVKPKATSAKIPPTGQTKIGGFFGKK